MRLVKNGLSRHGNQRWLCRVCGHTQGGVDRRRIAEDLREAVLDHYMKGASPRSTESLLGVSRNTVMKWVLKAIEDMAYAEFISARARSVIRNDWYRLLNSRNQLMDPGGLLIAIPITSADGRWTIISPKDAPDWMRSLLKTRKSASAASSEGLCA